MYYIVEVLNSKTTKTVDETEDRDQAYQKAYKWSAKSGLLVEIQNEFGKILDKVWAHRD